MPLLKTLQLFNPKIKIFLTYKQNNKCTKLKEEGGKISIGKEEEKEKGLKQWIEGKVLESLIQANEFKIKLEK